MTPIMSTIFFDASVIASIVSTTRPTVAPPRPATLDADCARAFASRALSAFWRTVAVSSSIEDAVSSSAAACNASARFEDAAIASRKNFSAPGSLSLATARVRVALTSTTASHSCSWSARRMLSPVRRAVSTSAVFICRIPTPASTSIRLRTVPKPARRRVRLLKSCSFMVRLTVQPDMAKMSNFQSFRAET